ncbi:Mov34-domain-containing protein [Dacryopinax primogenitus]|uniref:COP9 signalosome complex subunit 5 n=1 Tax=Dacryopinax primogenitus (strain DJM 731) TaxID=1858805 RepID=M5G088_DACPD|nr:Mov34-domain-containing protein [Dacryopinax primogenitus]EJT99231.1 Mov34-domain-containing protein [Dacryopinax primogenitus]
MANAHAHAALQTFSIENDILNVPAQHELYKFDTAADKKVQQAAPWSKDPHHFKSVKISAIALIKMVIHARSGVPWEIMGMMQGKVTGDLIVILDAFALPVQGTETRVNAAAEANEYMVLYQEGSKQAGRMENTIGWYHSHPGYGCWLSGIDVDTQNQNQKYQDPFVAVVVDPNRTISAGKVDIGAFRTYPEDYKPPLSSSSQQYQSIPLNKIEDFGVHSERYYQLPISIFKSPLDDKLLNLLWNKYWVGTLSQSPLISNRSYAISQTLDLAEKLQRISGSLSSRQPPAIALPPRSSATSTSALMANLATSDITATPGKGKEKETEKPKVEKERKVEETQLGKAVRDSTKIASEAQHGLIAQVLKDVLFSARPGEGIESSTAGLGGGVTGVEQQIAVVSGSS